MAVTLVTSRKLWIAFHLERYEHWELVLLAICWRNDLGGLDGVGLLGSIIAGIDLEGGGAGLAVPEANA